MTPRLQLYGTGWCRFTFGLREYLMTAHVEYDYFDIDRDLRAEAFVKTMNDGKRKYPMVVIAERVITNPTVGELHQLLDANALLRRVRPVRRTVR